MLNKYQRIFIFSSLYYFSYFYVFSDIFCYQFVTPRNM